MPALESPVLQAVSSHSDSIKSAPSYPGGNGSGYKGNGSHFCSQGQTLEKMQRAIAQLAEDAKDGRTTEGDHFKTLNDATAKVLEEIIVLGHRVSRIVVAFYRG